MVKVKNTKTGLVLEIPESQVKNMSSQWQVVSNTSTTSSTQQPQQYVYGNDQFNYGLNDSAINHLYQSYFHRDATKPELNNWRGVKVKDLEDFLKSERVRYHYNKPVSNLQNTNTNTNNTNTNTNNTNTNNTNTNTNNTVNTQNTTETTTEGMTAQEKQQINDLNAKIDAMDLPIEQKAILKEIVRSDNYTSGQHIPTDAELSQIIQDAAKNAETDLSPYYQTLTQRELEDVKNNFANIRETAANYQQQESMNYKARLAATKQNLRMRGLTFSGMSRATLGKEGALQANGVEGTLPTNRRLSYENQIAQYKNQAQKVGTVAERDLGSSALQGLNTTINTPYGNRKIFNPQGNIQTGDIALQRLKDIEKSKWNRVSKYQPYI